MVRRCLVDTGSSDILTSLEVFSICFDFSIEKVNSFGFYCSLTEISVIVVGLSAFIYDVDCSFHIAAYSPLTLAKS